MQHPSAHTHTEPTWPNSPSVLLCVCKVTHREKRKSSHSRSRSQPRAFLRSFLRYADANTPGFAAGGADAGGGERGGRGALPAPNQSHVPSASPRHMWRRPRCCTYRLWRACFGLASGRVGGGRLMQRDDRTHVVPGPALPSLSDLRGRVGHLACPQPQRYHQCPSEYSRRGARGPPCLRGTQRRPDVPNQRARNAVGGA